MNWIAAKVHYTSVTPEQTEDLISNIFYEFGLQGVEVAEAGQRKIPASMLPKLSQLFDVPVEALLGMNEKAAKRGPAPILQRQIEQIRLLPRSKQRFVMEMLETVIRQQSA